MSTGIVHAKATQRNLRPLLIGAAASTYLYGPAALGLAVGSVLGHWITPDFDVNHPIYTQRRLIQKYGPLGWLWVAYWYPYRQFASHRGRSHHWPVGTLSRFIYLLWLPLYYSFGHIPSTYTVILALFWLTVYMGWSIQDWTHLRLDNIWPYNIGIARRSSTRIPKRSRPHYR